MISLQLGANGYSFIVDNNGKVLFHPDLRLPVRIFCHNIIYLLKIITNDGNEKKEKKINRFEPISLNVYFERDFFPQKLSQSMHCEFETRFFYSKTKLVGTKSMEKNEMNE